jgi:RNA-directed DNA polymerase
VVQAAVKAVIEPIFEADFLDCSFGFRTGRSQLDALETIRKEVNRGRVWIVDANIANCFDSFRKEVLADSLRERISDWRMLKLILAWLKGGVLAEGSLLHPETGTPQGGVASPLLANVVLQRLDREWQAHHRRLCISSGFADDLVILCPTPEGAEASLEALKAILAALGLNLATAKTRLVDLRDKGRGFDFWAFTISGWSPLPARAGTSAPLGRRSGQSDVPGRRSGCVPSAGFCPSRDVVRNVNQYLVAWRNYFRHGNSTTVFHDLDRFTVERVARFISKKHGHSGNRCGFFVLKENDYLGPLTLVGNICRPVHGDW